LAKIRITNPFHINHIENQDLRFIFLFLRMSINRDLKISFLNIDMKKLFVIGILLSLLATNAFALQQVAGTIIISTPIGGSNSAQYGLMNDGNETITVSLRAEGNAAKYLSFPSNVTLEPKKFVYTNITATLPSDYDLGQNITGTLYALQEGTSGGQVKINIQLMKSVIISVYGQPKQVTSSEQTNQGASSQLNEANSPSGLVTLISNNSFVIVLVIALVVIAFILMRRKKILRVKAKRRK
jgi:hypothetical protein